MATEGITFCCGVPYEGAGRCIVCNQPLWKARVKEKAKKKSVKSVVEQMEEEKKLKHKLLVDSLKFAVEQAKRMNPNKMVECQCCGERKLFFTFQWIYGDKPQYDLMADEFDPALYEAYGKFFNYKDLVCGSCAANYRNNNLPRTIAQTKETAKRNMRRLNKKRRPALSVPYNGVCPKCGEYKGLDSKWWSLVSLKSSETVCRKCKNRLKNEENEKYLREYKARQHKDLGP